MGQVVRIPENLYRRLGFHAKGFETPANVIEKMLNFYEEKKGVESTVDFEITSNALDSLEIIYYPSSEDSFKQALLKNKKAYILLHKVNGTTEFREWNASRFGIDSDVNGNLRSGYLRGWKHKGIFKAEISTNKNDLSYKKSEQHGMTTTNTESIVAEFKECGVILSKMPGKKIIYDGKTRNNTSIVVAMPESKIYDRGNGWVDFTKIQIDIFKQYLIAIAVFRLSDGTTHKYDMNNLFPLLTPDNMMENEKEGEHWKIDIWPNKLVIRNGNQTLNAQPDQKQFINNLVNSKH